MDPITGKASRFDWSSFVFPSCRSCNESYSEADKRKGSVIVSDLPKLPNSDSDREERAAVVKLRKSDLVGSVEMPSGF